MKSGFVSFIGRPNAGKSTLLNRLVGSKLAIVSDKPQTTRTRILGVKHYPDAQVVFLDTPGIHRPLHRMNVRMVDTAVDTIREVDVLGLVVDVTEPPGKGDRFVIDLVKHATSPVFLILNKIDLIKKLAAFPHVVEGAARAHEPHRLAFYLYDLASAFHTQWTKGNELPHLRFIQASDGTLTAARLALIRANAQVLASGLALIGVHAPEEMR